MADKSKAEAAPQKTESKPAAPRVAVAPRRVRHPVRQLQRAGGNRLAQDVIRSERYDPLERRARQTAAAVMRAGLPPAAIRRTPIVARPAAAHQGQPLDCYTRAFMESRFGYDFGGVRVHTGAAADRAARGMNADAFAYGSALVFREGFYAPEDPQGLHLIAHELAHVVQQAQMPQPRIQRQEATDAGTPPVGTATAPPTTPPAGPPAESLVFEGHTLSTDPARVRTEVTAVLLQASVAGMYRFLGRFDSSIRADQNRIADLRRQIEASAQLARDLARYGPGDVSGVPLNSTQITDLENEIRQLQTQIDLKQRIRPVLASTIDEVRDEPQVGAADVQITARLANTHALYRAIESYRLANQAYSMGRALRGSARDPTAAADALDILQERRDQARQTMERELAAQGFRTVEEFEQATAQFEAFFARYASQTAFAMLSENEELVLAEKNRYGTGSADVGAMYNALQPARDHLRGVDRLQAERSSYRREHGYVEPWTGQWQARSREEREEDQRYEQRIEQIRTETKDMIRNQSGAYPILADPDLYDSGMYRLLSASRETLSGQLRTTADDRLANIRDARQALMDDPEEVWSLDQAIQRAKASLGIGPNSVYAAIIQAKLDRIEFNRMLFNLFVAALAIGVALLTGGVGGAVLGAAISVGMAAQHYLEYQRQAAFAGSAFDRARALSSNEPSLFWLAVDIAGAVLELGAAARAFSALARPAREAVSAVGAARRGGPAAEAALDALRREGDAVQQGLGDVLVARARRMARDEEFLEVTARVSPSPQQLERELEIARNYPSRRLTSGEYIEEITLPNGHTWRRNRTGQWCRFTTPVCMTAINPPGVAAATAPTEALTAANAAERATLMRLRNSSTLSRRPGITQELNELIDQVAQHGDNVPQQLVDRLRAVEDRLARLSRTDAISTAPRNLPLTEATFEAGSPYYARMPDLGPGPGIIEFPDGTRVWRETPGGPIFHEAGIGPGPGRAGYEHGYYSRGAHGNLPPEVDWERAHSLGQGTGFESPYGILYAPSYVNQTLQNNGVELLMRQLTALQDANTSFRVITRTTSHSGMTRLSEITYRVEVISGGQAHPFFDYAIQVARDAPYRITAAPINFATNPVAAAQRARVNVPDILTRNVSEVAR